MFVVSATPLTLLKLCVLETSLSLACTFYEFVKVCRCFYATNENIHVLSMKFPHLFLRPEIIITFLWGWEWSGGQVRHRSPWNSGFKFFLLLGVSQFSLIDCGVSKICRAEEESPT